MRGELRRGAAQLLLQPIMLPVQERLLPLTIGGAGRQRPDRLRGLVFLRGQIRADLALLVELPLRGGELPAQRGSLFLRPRGGHLALLHRVAQLALPVRPLAAIAQKVSPMSRSIARLWVTIPSDEISSSSSDPVVSR